MDDVKSVMISDVEYKIIIDDYFPPKNDFNNVDKVYDLLNKKVNMVSHDWEGHVDKLLINKYPTTLDKSWFEPIDKGRPSITIFGGDNMVAFSFAIYENERELVVFDKKCVNMW
jgi:hypothetical protein